MDPVHDASGRVVHAEDHDLPGVARVRLGFAADGRLLRLELVPEGPPPGGRRPAAAPDREAVAAWLAAYGDPAAPPFPGRWELPGRTPFARRVHAAVAALAPGETATYAEVAARAGSPRAARAVGNLMAANPLPLVVPCHRVVAAAGLGGFGGGTRMKRALLAREGVAVQASATPTS